MYSSTKDVLFNHCSSKYYENSSGKNIKNLIKNNNIVNNLGLDNQKFTVGGEQQHRPIPNRFANKIHSQIISRHSLKGKEEISKNKEIQAGKVVRKRNNNWKKEFIQKGKMLTLSQNSRKPPNYVMQMSLHPRSRDLPQSSQINRDRT